MSILVLQTFVAYAKVLLHSQNLRDMSNWRKCEGSNAMSPKRGHRVWSDEMAKAQQHHCNTPNSRVPVCCERSSRHMLTADRLSATAGADARICKGSRPKCTAIFQQHVVLTEPNIQLPQEEILRTWRASTHCLAAFLLPQLQATGGERSAGRCRGMASCSEAVPRERRTTERCT